MGSDNNVTSVVRLSGKCQNRKQAGRWIKKGAGGKKEILNFKFLFKVHIEEHS